jgi:hypothetical protein
MNTANPWRAEVADDAVVRRLAAAHEPDVLAVELNVDLVADPHRDDVGNLWTLLRSARRIEDVVPGSAVMIGSHAGRWPARVLAWDLEVSDDDPVIVTLELLPARCTAVAQP